MLLFYLRHGDPIYAPDSLTPLGHRQAEALAKRLATFGLDRIYASTSDRARQTAQPTCELLKKEAVLLDFANEGHAWADLTITAADGNKKWLFQDPETVLFFHSADLRTYGAEWYRHSRFAEYHYERGLARIADGIDDWLRSLGYEHVPESGSYRVIRPNEERVALFAHQGFGLAFLSCLLDIPYPMICTHFDMCHTGMTVIEFTEQNGYAVPKILTLSSDSHLYRDGLPTQYNYGPRF